MLAKPRPRILYYVQSLVGIGHTACSLRIASELLADCDVDFIQGGRLLDGPAGHPGFRNLDLPTLLIREDSEELYDPDAGRSVDDVWADRARAIDGFLQPPYAAMVVEFYPFGRRRFKREIQGLIERVRASSGPVPLFSSVREILIPAPIDTERRIVEAIQRDFHSVFVRGDPDVVRLDETFTLAEQLGDKLVYTGYVAPPPPVGCPERKRQILVSQGGGDVGRNVLEAAIGVAPRMPDYQFLLAAGARTSAAELVALRGKANSPNVRIEPFLKDFPRRLQESALSISLGGDNTLLEVIGTRTPALAYPYQGNSEQTVRIDRLARLGFIHPLSDADLVPQQLKEIIICALNKPYPAKLIAMNGANVTARKIRAALTG